MSQRASTLFASLCVLYAVAFSEPKTEYAKAFEYLHQRGEVYFAIHPKALADLKPLVDVISLDRIVAEKPEVFAYATKQAFEAFLSYTIPYEVKTPPSLEIVPPMSDYAGYLSRSKNDAPSGDDWYSYPTYQAYVAILNKWVASYPTLAKLYDLGPSGVASKNHRIYGLRLSSNVGVEKGKPKYLETNVIHGDEVLNMMNCLHMVDTILSSYGKPDQARFTAFLDSLDMWFIPNMNPDATYKSGDNTVSGAQRHNVADGFDLNRNNPCPCEKGNHKLYGLYNYYAKETQALMGLHAKYKFPFAQDQHGGTETYLWPYGGIPKTPNDEGWYKAVIKRLVGQIHKDCNNNGYMTSCGGDGMGNIYSELYECHGIRCDFNDWGGHGKSVTLESSLQKLLDASKLKDHWKWCKEALMMSYELLIKEGLHGFVTDSLTGKPIFEVSVTRNNDWPQNSVLTDSCGKYVKFMNDGTWSITFAHPKYVSKTVDKVSMFFGQRTNLSVKLLPKNIYISAVGAVPAEGAINVVSAKGGVTIVARDLDKAATIGIYSINGKLVQSFPAGSGPEIRWNGVGNKGAAAGNGLYTVKIVNRGKPFIGSFFLNR